MRLFYYAVLQLHIKISHGNAKNLYSNTKESCLTLLMNERYINKI